ncbi:hypothetical protein MMC25_006672 [Agyrium rufum]|nr:hypothetical protein [Agyrium rufum]
MSDQGADLVHGASHQHLNKSCDIDFTIIRTLRRRGYGTVDHVRSNLPLHEYARKRIARPRSLANSKRALTSFEREIHNLKRLSHIQLVKLVASYTDPNYFGFIAEPVVDIDLRRYLMRDPFPPEDFANPRCFLGCLCAAVKYLHEQSCCHQDLKPGNTLIKDGTIWITDFSTSLNWTASAADTTDGRPNAYKNAYAAPEVAPAKPRNPSADIWSLGCIFFDIVTVLTGKTLERRKSFFTENGSASTHPHQNFGALLEWIDVLKAQNQEYLKPLTWIKQTTAGNPADRIDAPQLFGEIIQRHDNHIYCGLCCSEESNSEETSWCGSDSDVGAEDITGSIKRSKVDRLSPSYFHSGSFKASVETRTLQDLSGKNSLSDSPGANAERLFRIPPPLPSRNSPHLRNPQ